MYYSIPVAISFLVHWIIHRDFYKKPAITQVSREFKGYLSVISFYYVADAAWGLLYKQGNPQLLYADTVLYYLMMGLSVVFCCRYVIAFLDLNNRLGTILNIVGQSFFVLEFIVLVVNMFHPLLFFVDSECNYHTTPIRYAFHYLLLAMFAAISITSLWAMVRASGYKRKRYSTICAFGFVMVVSLILQTLFPMYPLYSIGIMVGTLVIHVFIHEYELQYQFAMIDGLIRDYSTIWLVDKKTLRMQLVRTTAQELVDIAVERGVNVSDYQLTWPKYLELYVADTDRKRVEQEVAPGAVVARLEKEDSFVVNYLKTDETGKLAYHQLSFHNVENQGVKDQFILGLRNVDSIISEERVIKQQLEDARRAAEAANDAKTSFLFNMSHDIRTPMNAIIGFRTLLEKHQDDPLRRADYLAKMEDSSNVLLGIINNVLEMARIEKGSVEVVESDVDIYSFAQQVGAIFRDMMKQKGVKFSHSIDVRHTSFSMDPIKVREVMINLISNAYKYTNPGGKVHAALREEPHPDEGFSYIVTEISDTGIGMSEEFLPHIFEEFSRERISTQNKIEGTGLGMPIVKRLVEMMNGTIKVASKKGEGTTITVAIPHRVVTSPSAVEPEADVVVDSLEAVNKRLLLAEDNDLNAEIAMELLGEYGFKCERAANGQEAVDMLANAPEDYFDLVLMDIQMPVLNGYEATSAIRAMDCRAKASIPILAMTANAFEEDRRKSVSCGMNGHLAKPIDIGELLRELNKLI